MTPKTIAGLLARQWELYPGDTECARIDDPHLPHIVAGRDKDDGDYRRGKMFWWGVYYEGTMMPATFQGWTRTPENARRAAERTIAEHGTEAWA